MEADTSERWRVVEADEDENESNMKHQPAIGRRTTSSGSSGPGASGPGVSGPGRSSWRTLLLCLLLMFHASPPPSAAAAVLPDIYWNITNPMFLISNTDHILPVRLLDVINIRCPYTPPDRVRFNRTMPLAHSQIYSVSKWSYEHCELAADSRVVGTCDDQYIQQLITVIFRQFTPSKHQLEFRAGRDYYFISTSTGTKSGLTNRQGGLCRERNMRLKFEVLRDGELSRSNRLPDAGTSYNDLQQHDSSRGRHVTTGRPIMYIVETRAPDDPYMSELYADNEVRDDPDGAMQTDAPRLLLLFIVLFSIFRWQIN